MAYKDNLIIKDKDINVDLIEQYLKHNKLSSAICILNKYLELLNKNEYKILLNNLIKICICEKERSFKEVIDTLNLIIEDEFDLDIDRYILKFKNYYCLNHNISSLYYQIICEYDSNQAKKIKDNYNISNIDDKRIIELENELSNINQLNVTDIEYPGIDNVKLDYMIDKINSLEKNDPVILLPKMSPRKMKIALEKLKMLNFNDYLIVGIDSEKQIALIYREPKKFNIKKLIINAEEALKNKDYRTCIKYSKRLIAFAGTLKAQSFFTIGLSYFYNNKYDEALKYLLVTQKLNEEEHNNKDVIKLIYKIQNYKIIKPMNDCRYNEKYFTVKDENEIENYSIILKELVENNLNFEKTINKYNLDKDNLNYLKLLIAREFYSQGYYAKGDKLVKEVMNVKNKSYQVKKLLKHINDDKLFYINRKDEYEIAKIMMKK